MFDNTTRQGGEADTEQTEQTEQLIFTLME